MGVARRQSPRSVRPVGASVLLRHCGRVVTCNHPLLSVPIVGVRVASLDFSTSSAKGERIKSGIDRGVASNLDGSCINLADGLVFEEVMEIVLLLGSCESRLIRYGGKEDRAVGVVGDNFVWIAGLQ